MIENLDFTSELRKREYLWIVLAGVIALAIVAITVPAGFECWTRDEQILKTIRETTENCTYQDYPDYPHIQQGSFGELNVTFIKYDALNDRMLMLLKKNEYEYDSLGILIREEVPFKYLIEKGDNINLIVYCHPRNPVYDVPIDMRDKNGTCYTVVQINWHPRNYDKEYKYNIELRPTDGEVSKYLYLSIGAAVLMTMPVIKKSRTSKILMTSFLVPYLVSFVLYLLKLGVPSLFAPILRIGNFGAQVDYVTFISLSLWAMVITFEMGLETKREAIGANERDLLLTFTTLITLISVVVTFVGGLLAPSAPRIAELNIPARMAVVLFGTILGLNAFLIGILGRGIEGVFTWGGRIFVMVLGSLFSIIALAYTGGYYYSIFFAIGMIVLVGGFLFLYYDRSVWRPWWVPVLRGFHRVLKRFPLN